MLAHLLAQMGVGPINIGRDMDDGVDTFCWWLIIAPLCCVGLAWVGAAIAQKRYSLGELMLFVGYWAGVFAIAKLILS